MREFVRVAASCFFASAHFLIPGTCVISVYWLDAGQWFSSLDPIRGNNQRRLGSRCHRGWANSASAPCGEIRLGDVAIVFGEHRLGLGMFRKQVAAV